MKAFVVIAALFLAAASHATETVNGYSFAETIFIGDLMHWTGSIFVNQGPHTYNTSVATLTSIALTNGEALNVNGLGGNDIIVVANSTNSYLPVYTSSTDFLKPITSVTPGQITVDGGDGDDTIVGSDGDDYIFGGTGDDTIYGRGGDDHIIGDTQSCSLDSTCTNCETDGDDTCYGEEGDDGILCDTLADGGNDDGDVCDGDAYGSGCDKEDFCDFRS